MELRHLVGFVAVVAIALGLVAAVAVLFALNAVLPPFVEEIDDHSAREFVPVALAYSTWAATTIVVVLLALRRFLREDLDR